MSATPSGHDELRDQAALYVLGALPPGERAAFEAHAATCPECAAEIEALRPVVDGLAEAVPQHVPPIQLRERVLAGVATGAPAVRPGTRANVPDMAWLLAAASLVLAVGLAVYALQLRSRVEALDAELRARSAETDTLERRLIELQGTAVRAQQIAAVLTAPDVARIDLDGQPKAPSARARAFWSDSRDTLVFQAANLPPLAPRRSYQIWVITPDNQKISAGIVAPDAMGAIDVVVPTPPGMPPPGAVAVTEEPEGGLPQPSGEMYLAGAAL